MPRADRRAGGAKRGVCRGWGSPGRIRLDQGSGRRDQRRARGQAMSAAERRAAREVRWREEAAASLAASKCITRCHDGAMLWEHGLRSTRPAIRAKLPAPGLSTRFTPRQRPRSPDRKAWRDRRRLLGGSSALPPNLRHHYTEGQRAVLCIVAGEVKRHGVCDLPIDKIAALARVCRTTVQTTMHEARRLGHIAITERPRPGCKNLPNMVEIISREWRTWLKRGPSVHGLIGSNSSKMVSATKSRSISTGDAERAVRSQRAGRGVQEARPRPPDLCYGAIRA